MRTTLTPVDEPPIVGRAQAAAMVGLSAMIAGLVAVAAAGVLSPLTIAPVADAGAPGIGGIALRPYLATPAPPSFASVPKPSLGSGSAAGTSRSRGSVVAGRSASQPASPVPVGGPAPIVTPPTTPPVVPPGTTGPITQPTPVTQPEPEAPVLGKITPRSTTSHVTHNVKVHKPKAKGKSPGSSSSGTKVKGGPGKSGGKKGK